MIIRNSIIIITGASQGIGRATAHFLAHKGAKVVVASRSRKELKKLADELPDALAVPTDIRKPSNVTHLIEATLKKYGRIDMLINNAGQGMYGPVESIDIEHYHEIIELNLIGALRTMQAVIPCMRNQGFGMIVNVSSRVSKNYFPGLAAYASTKYALNAISLTARTELAPEHIIVSVIYPKMTATNFGTHAFSEDPQEMNDASMVSRAREAGMQIDTPEQVAEAIGELIVSEEAELEM